MICVLFICLSLFKGVFGVDAVKSLSVLEGDSVTLHAGLTEIQTDDLILWTFGLESTRIAQINKRTNKFSLYDDVLDNRFRGRLELDDQTGDLTITNTTTELSGLYELQIFAEKAVPPKKFSIMVYYVVEPTIKTERGLSSSHIVLICVLVGVFVLVVAPIGIFIIHRKCRNTDQADQTRGQDTELSDADGVIPEKVELKTVSVTVGEPVTLNTGLTEIQRFDVLQWRFGELGPDHTNPFEVIARVNELNNSGCHDHDDRVHLDRKTGYLTINNIRPTDLGIYKLNITRNGKNMISKTFIVHDSSEREDASEETNSLLRNAQISESSRL